MSQKKVDEYKAKKANRKAIMKKEKRKHMCVSVAGALFLLVIGGWIGYSIYDSYLENKPRQMVEVDYTSMEQYIQEITSTE